MASPSGSSLDKASIDLSKGIEKLTGSYFEAAACGVTGARPNQEDAHVMMSFSVAPDLLALTESNSTTPPPTSSAAASPVKTVFSTTRGSSTKYSPPSSASPGGKATSALSAALAKQKQEQAESATAAAADKNPFSASLVSSINKTYSCFGVFDGHGGQHCSNYMSKELPSAVQGTLKKFATDLQRKRNNNNNSSNPSSPTTPIIATTSPLTTPPLMMMDSKEARNQLEDRMIKTFQEVDKKYLTVELADDPAEDMQQTFGSTCVFVVLEPVSSKDQQSQQQQTPSSNLLSPNANNNRNSPNNNNLGSSFSGTSIPPTPGAPIVARAMVCNLGDSRCMVLRNGQIVFRTIDQKPETPKERERIEKCKNPRCADLPPGSTINSGGFISSNFYVTGQSPCRINDVISVARSFGDKPFKPYLDPNKDPVSCTPKIDFVDLYKNDVLLLGCDGLYDGPFFAENHLVSHITERVEQLAARYDYQHWGPRNRGSNDPFTIPFATLSTTCAEVCHKAIGGGSRDNISAMLVRLAEDHLLHQSNSRLTRRRSSGGGLNGNGMLNNALSSGNSGGSSPQPLLSGVKSGGTATALGAMRKRSSTTVGKTPEPYSSPTLLKAAQENNSNSNNSNNTNNPLPDMHQQNTSTFLQVTSGDGGDNSNNNLNGTRRTGRASNNRRRASSVLANHPSQQRSARGTGGGVAGGGDLATFEGTLPGLQDTQKISGDIGESSINKNLAPSHSLGVVGRPRHVRSHSSQNFYPNNNNNSNNNQNTSARQGGGGRNSVFGGHNNRKAFIAGLLGEDPLLLINKLQSKFVAGPLPECNESWLKFIQMAKLHETDANVAAEKRLRFLRAAHDETEQQKKQQALFGFQTPVTSGDAPLQQQLSQASMSMPIAEQTGRGGGLGLVVTTSMSCQLSNNTNADGGVTSGRGTAGGTTTMLEPTMTGTQFIQANTSCVQQYAARLVASGDYTEEEIALLTCQQSPADLALEYKKMLTIYKVQKDEEAKEALTFNITIGSTSASPEDTLNNKSGSGKKITTTIDDCDEIAEILPGDTEWIAIYRRFVERTSVAASKDILKAGCGEGRGFGDSFSEFGSSSATQNTNNNANLQGDSNSNNNNPLMNNSNDGGGGIPKPENDKNNILLLVTQQLNDDNGYDDDDDYEEGEEYYDDDDDNLGGCFRGGGGGDDDDDDFLDDGDDDDDQLGDDDDDEDGLNSTLNAMKKLKR